MNHISKYLSLLFILSSCASNPEITSELNELESDEEKICRSEKVMGSKIPQTTCYTKEELERLEEKSKKILEKEQRTRQQMKTMGGVKPE
jgi:hypothetical protein